jgi:lipopolysaccharide/colanic/teichoic acid biosynthesis glycosyltransferase
VKRPLDIIISLIIIVVFMPFAMIIAVILKFTGEGEIFFVQKRIGLNGTSFGLIKYATMLKNSPDLGTGMLTVKNDARVLPFGRFLRATKLNEIPQFLNVLKGDMSIIGPRPQAREHFNLFPEHIRNRLITVRPGLSGIGSIVFRDEECIIDQSHKPPDACYSEEITPYKGELELWYIENQSLWLDLRLMLLTAWAIVFPCRHIEYRLIDGLPRSSIIHSD